MDDFMIVSARTLSGKGDPVLTSRTGLALESAVSDRHRCLRHGSSLRIGASEAAGDRWAVSLGGQEER